MTAFARCLSKSSALLLPPPLSLSASASARRLAARAKPSPHTSLRSACLCCRVPPSSDNRRIALRSWHSYSLNRHDQRRRRRHPHHPPSASLSTVPVEGVGVDDSDSDDSDADVNNNSNNAAICRRSVDRLSSIRNVGIFAHVDAGKTTVTERMLALSGVVRSPGSVDDGDTVTDYLPAERERGITIQSAAVGFEWVVPPPPPPPTASSSAAAAAAGGTKEEEQRRRGRRGEPTRVSVNLIDTPGHVDFSVEVHRSVAVLDGAVLVVDAVAGVQAQTETVWRAMRNVDAAGGGGRHVRGDGGRPSSHYGSHAHEPLPALMFVNKMDREGADYRRSIESVRRKLGGSNPIAVQLPLYRRQPSSGAAASSSSSRATGGVLGDDIVAGGGASGDDHGEFVGVLDLVHMRAILYPDGAESLSMEDAVPSVVYLSNCRGREPLTRAASDGRRELVSNLADVDEVMEDLYLHAMMIENNEEEEDGGGGGADCPILDGISTEEIQSSLRRMTLERRVMPTMCGAALRGVGVEPLLDCVAEYLPCPLDRLPPQLRLLGNNNGSQKPRNQSRTGNEDDGESIITLGHPLHSSTVAYVFKVLHMKGRGGSGDGRVAFARVYSGTLKARDSVRVISPGIVPSHDGEGGRNNNNGKKQKHPVERIGGMLELSGGQFGNMPDGSCRSGDVCALVGLKGVVTGDTLLSMTGDGGASSAAAGGDGKKKSSKKRMNNDIIWKQYMDGVHLAGLTSPKPVLTLRVEAYSTSEQSRLSSALALLAVEDPSLVVEETPTTTLISGLGELHMEIVLDRLRREFGLEVRTGKPAVAYRETLSLKDGEVVESDGLVEYDRTVGGVRLQGAVQLLMRQSASPCTSDGSTRSENEICRAPEDPVVTLSPETRSFFNLDPLASSDELEHKYPPALQALLSGVRGSMKRGRLGPYPLANLECRIVLVHSELSSADTLPGAMRAAAANAVTTMLETLTKEGRMTILEPKMNVEIWVPTGRVGDVLSDLTVRRGMVDDVAMADEGIGGGDHVKSMVRAEVPLVEILGYANSLRSLTGGEGAFSAEYKGHAPQDGV